MAQRNRIGVPMAECDVCGKDAGLKKAEIDGVILSVCDDCARLGKAVYQPRPVMLPKRREPLDLPGEEKELAEDFAARIRKAREQRSLTQDDAAKAIGISHLILKRVENGFRPDDATISKIQRFYGINVYVRNG